MFLFLCLPPLFSYLCASVEKAELVGVYCRRLDHFSWYFTLLYYYYYILMARVWLWLDFDISHVKVDRIYFLSPVILSVTWFDQWNVGVGDGIQVGTLELTSLVLLPATIRPCSRYIPEWETYRTALKLIQNLKNSANQQIHEQEKWMFLVTKHWDYKVFFMQY